MEALRYGRRMDVDASTGRGLDARVVRTRADVLQAAVRIVVEDGLDALTQPGVARAAGYSKATVYAHWPDRVDLIRDTFERLGEMPHHEPTGDVRADLVGELRSFRQAMEEQHLDRILAVLAERATTVPALAPIRDRFVADGERPIRRLLARHLRGARLEAAVLMLCGTVVHAALLHGERPTDAVLDRAVDGVMAMIASTAS